MHDAENSMTMCLEIIKVQSRTHLCLDDIVWLDRRYDIQLNE